MSLGPVLSLGQAVNVSNVSRSTLQRRLYAGEIDGAQRTTSGAWRIPYAALVAAELIATTPTTKHVDLSLVTTPHDSYAADLVVKIAELTADLDKWRTLAIERENERDKAQKLAADLVDVLQRTPALVSQATTPQPVVGVDTPVIANVRQRRRLSLFGRR